MYSQFLSPAEVAQLTGRKHAKLQIDNLRKNGIPFTVNASGRPIVNRDNLIGQPKPQKIKQQPQWQPNVA